MNEEAIKALKALLNHPVDGMMRNALKAAINDLEKEHVANEARLRTLCQNDGSILTSDPPLYRCVWCYHTWYCHSEPPVCIARGGRDYKPTSSNWMYT